MVNTEISLIILFAIEDEEALYSQQKQDQELTVAQIMNSLFFGKTDAETEAPIFWPPDEEQIH